jgi:hypothetical protein
MLSLRFFRIATFLAACVLAAYASWILAAEVVRSPSPPFIGAIPATTQEQDRAAEAAQRGVIRGDLWAEDAILLAAGLQNDVAGGGLTPASDTLEAARTAAERAARLAPHDSRMWLLVAAIDSRLDWLDRRIEGPLKMSYFTAPNDPALMTLRLIIATRSNVIQDPDLQLLVSAEIRAIIKSRPDLRPSIIVAHRDALAPGRRFIESTLEDFDAELLAQIRAKGAPP